MVVGIFSVNTSQVTQIAYLCTPYRTEMKKSRTLLLALIIALATLIGCHDKPKTTTDKIEQLKYQVGLDAVRLESIESHQYGPLKNDFHHCDSMLQYLNETEIDACFEKLQLAQAYLLQFEMVKPIMENKMNYLLGQLDHLKADLESQYLNDSIALVYFDTENRVADTLHEQILYFGDRFGQCQKDLNALKKSWK